MKRILLGVIIISNLLTLNSCKKSESTTITNPLEAQYKTLTSDNVTAFFLDTSKAYRGCAGSNCQSVFEFSFKNLSYVSEIAITAYSNTPSPIWTYYTTEKQDVKTYGNYYANEYRLRFTLKDGRVLTGPWIQF